MPRTRNIFFHGLGITLRRFPALLWAYVFHLGLALAFCVPLYRQLSSLMSHSLASQQLASGFDLSVVMGALLQLRGDHAGQMTAMTSHGSILAYLLIYFLLVPGTLYSYVVRRPAKLSTLLYQGMLHFWRFVRITLLTLLAGLVLLGPLLLIQRRWAEFVDDRFVGRTSLLLTLAGLLVILLVASLLRLYFDLVEVYIVQLGTHRRLSDRPDRRVRRTLRPAFRLLRSRLIRAWMIFLALAIAGSVVVFFTSRIAMHMLAKPHAWPMFLIAQLGLFVMLFMRFWQRGVEASLVLQNPITTHEDSFLAHETSYTRSTPITTNAAPPPSPKTDHPHHIEMMSNPDPLVPIYPAPLSPDDPLIAEAPLTPDPIPNPEPASPSLDEPDPGVFHHDPQSPSRSPTEPRNDS